MKEEYIIVFSDRGVCEVYYATSLENAIKECKCNDSYKNYGFNNAKVFRGQLLYEIKEGPIEKSFL